MKTKLNNIDAEIEKLNLKIEQLNNDCASAMAKITGDGNARVLSYAKEVELNETIEKYTKVLAKLIVDLEELELKKQELEDGEDI